MADLNNIQNMYEGLNNLYVSRCTKRDSLKRRLDDIDSKLVSIDIDKLEKANLVLQKMAEKQRRDACNELEQLGTYALQYSLGANYEMKIETDKARGKPVANVYIYKSDTGIKSSPRDANGGGVVDIISMALRFVAMQSHDPFIDGPAILDEPYKHVSKEYIPQIASFIKNLVNDFNRQIILSTHNDFLAQIADNQIHVRLGSGNESIVEEKNVRSGK